MESDLYDKGTLETEAARQNEFLNGVLGIVTFTLAFSCIGLPNPQKGALVGLLLVFPLLIKAASVVPETVVILRQLAKEHPENSEIKELLSHLESKYLGAKSLLKNNLVYLSGIALYLAVLLLPEFSVWVKSI